MSSGDRAGYRQGAIQELPAESQPGIPGHNVIFLTGLLPFFRSAAHCANLHLASQVTFHPSRSNSVCALNRAGNARRVIS